MANKGIEVTLFLDEQNHPLRKEIEELRDSILSANKKLTENIKWNGPNYCFENEDRITMRIMPTTIQHLQLICHRGSKKADQPKERIIENKSKLLVWKENDRAIATFKNLIDIKNSKTELNKIINDWIKA